MEFSNFEECETGQGCQVEGGTLCLSSPFSALRDFPNLQSQASFNWLKQSGGTYCSFKEKMKSMVVCFVLSSGREIEKVFDTNKCSVKGAGYPFAGFCTRFGILISLPTVSL